MKEEVEESKVEAPNLTEAQRLVLEEEDILVERIYKNDNE